MFPLIEFAYVSIFLGHMSSQKLELIESQLNLTSGTFLNRKWPEIKRRYGIFFKDCKKDFNMVITEQELKVSYECEICPAPKTFYAKFAKTGVGERIMPKTKLCPSCSAWMKHKEQDLKELETRGFAVKHNSLQRNGSVTIYCEECKDEIETSLHTIRNPGRSKKCKPCTQRNIEDEKRISLLPIPTSVRLMIYWRMRLYVPEEPISMQIMPKCMAWITDKDDKKKIEFTYFDRLKMLYKHIWHDESQRIKFDNLCAEYRADPCMIHNLSVAEATALICKCSNYNNPWCAYQSVKTFDVVPESDLKISPYILGIWLGDGNSSGAGLTNVDPEIIDEWIEYGKSLGLDARKNEITYYLTAGRVKGHGFKRISEYDSTRIDEVMLKVMNGNDRISGNDAAETLNVCPQSITNYRKIIANHGSVSAYVQKGRKNPFLGNLKSYNLIKNKHIPHIYMRASVASRAQLMAGLIDTDGTVGKHCQHYSITQKRKQLAYQIHELALSLGWWSIIRPIMKRCTNSSNDSVKKEYWHVTFCSTSENAINIPCRLERKKIYVNDKELWQPPRMVLQSKEEK